MTSIFGTDGKQTAVTIIEAAPNVVTQVKTKESDGYNALQLALGDKNEKHSTKSELNHFAKAQTSAKKFVKEFRDYSIEKTLGETISLDIFAEGDDVEVIGTTKGKGFQGVVKRHGFGGVGGQTHGQHDRQRAPGSLGNSSTGARVIKGMRMAGRTGGNRKKAGNLEIVKIFGDKNLLVVKGSIPGAKGSFVYVEK